MAHSKVTQVIVARDYISVVRDDLTGSSYPTTIRRVCRIAKLVQTKKLYLFWEGDFMVCFPPHVLGGKYVEQHD